ncbi:MAG TPA: alpha/beta hydrolase [Thermoanaerobaculia bacterium]|nr:alpha/beta hydrolase [Thermoanaerobaculia bacterium]
MRHPWIPALGAFVCALGLAGGAVAAETAAPAKKLSLGACTVPGLPPDAKCGTYEVWENRAAKSGRKIPLLVVVIPALGPDPLPDPFVYFAGGPGDSSVSGGGFLAQVYKDLRQRRDIFLVDFRGTGGSAPLNCQELQGITGVQGFLENFLPADRVKACGERLGKERDLTQYTSDNTIDDIDEVRAALGYEKVNLFGVSAGSRLVQIYLRRHPDRVRTATLWGVVPTDELGPFSMARSAQDSLDGLIAECAADAGCRAAFPKLKDDVAAVFARVDREPVVVSLTDPETGKPAEIRLSHNAVAQTLRYMMYVSSSAALLPLNVHLAAQGDWKPMAETARFFGGVMGSTADGYYLALTCAEDLPWIDEAKIPEAVRGTFLGEFRIRKQQAACAGWPTARLGREFLTPVQTDVPVLLISGERDPVTPPSNAEAVAHHFKTSRHVVVPDGGHSFEGISGVECVDQLITSFVQAGRLDGLDTASCVAGTKRPEFALKRDPEIELSVAQLTPFTGTYKSAETGFAVTVELLGKVLRVVAANQPPLVLVPVAPTRFRLEGMAPGYAMTFDLAEGKARAVTLEQPGGPATTLTREGS